MSLIDGNSGGRMDALTGNTIRTDHIPQVIQEWIRQLVDDRLLHQIIESVEREEQQVDIEMVCILRGSHGHAVLEPKITIRR